MARPDSRWMPLDWGDYWRDTAHLRGAGHGAYLNLIGAYWCRGEALPTDDAALEAMSKCSAKEWKAVRVQVLDFFDLQDGRYHHSRIDREIARAKSVYEKRVNRIRQVNNRRNDGRDENRDQSLQQPPPQPSEQASLQPLPPPTPTHSPNGETDANASVARTPAKTRRTRLEADWQPDPDSYAFAREQGLEHAEIAADIIEFCEYWRGPEPAKPLKADWNKTYRNHIRDYAQKIIARRPRAGKPGQHGSGAGSIVDVVARLKARAEMGGQNLGGGLGRGGDGLCAADDDRGDPGAGDSDGPPLIDADDAERMFGAVGGVEAPDEVPPRTHVRPGSSDRDLRTAAAGIPGGRSAEGPDDPAEHGDLLAGVGGTEGEAGRALSASPGPVIDADGYPEDFPAALRRNTSIIH